MTTTLIQEIPVRGGDLTVGTWGSASAEHAVLLIHGVTASHRAWDEFAPLLADAGFYVVAPDLRGRGRSAALPAPYGMQQHAADMADVMQHLGLHKATVVGHSMGGFVGITFAHRHPTLVEDLVLIDGGLPLSVPTGLDADEVIQLILGPTAERLTRTFASVEDYLSFWRAHPGFCDHWEPQYDAYFAYDLHGSNGTLCPATSYAAAREDTVDLVQGTTVPQALAEMVRPVLFVTCPRGLFNETPGLYTQEHLDQILTDYPQIRHARIDDVNHYNIVMGKKGAAALIELLKTEGVLS